MLFFFLRGCFSLELHFNTVNFSPLTVLFEEDNSKIFFKCFLVVATHEATRNRLEMAKSLHVFNFKCFKSLTAVRINVIIQTYTEHSTLISFFSWIYMYSFAEGLSKISGYIKNPQVSQDIDIVYLAKCFTPFFKEAETDLEWLFLMYNGDWNEKY